MPSTDHRFRYALEPALVRQSWRRDRAAAALAAAQAELAQCRAQLAEADTRSGQQAADATALWSRRQSPGEYTAVLRYLAGAQRAIAGLRARESELAQALSACKARLQQACVALDMLLEHRAEVKNEHVQAMGNLELAQVDRDWIMRAAARREHAAD